MLRIFFFAFAALLPVCAQTGSTGSSKGDPSIVRKDASGNVTVGPTVLDATTGVATTTDTTTPANPAAGKLKVYSKGGKWCSVSPAGTEYCNGDFLTKASPVFTGTLSGPGIIVGGVDTGVGAQALLTAGTGASRTAVGYQSGTYLTTGSTGVTAIGSQSGSFTGGGAGHVTTAANSVFIGYDSEPLADAETNEIVIGAGTRGAGSNTTTLGNASTVKTVINGAVYAPAVISSGTPSIIGCSATGVVGGGLAGKFAAGVTGACSVTLTPGVVAPNGWSCIASNIVTVANRFYQATPSAQSFTTLTGTTNVGDIITYICAGW